MLNYDKYLHYFKRSALSHYKVASHLYIVDEDDIGGQLKQKNTTDTIVSWYQVRFGFRKLENGEICLAVFSPDISSASAKWKLDLDIIDGSISRDGYVGKGFVFTVLGGLKFGMIHQSYAPTYTFFSSGNVTHGFNRSSSWLLGPQIGFNNKFLLGKNIHFYGNLTTSLCYQKYHVKAKQEYPEDPEQLDLNIFNYDSQITPIVLMSTGFGFDLFAPKNRYHLSASFGYEFQSYWRQNLMRELVETAKFQASRGSDNLYLHGVIAKATFDF